MKGRRVQFLLAGALALTASAAAIAWWPHPPPPPEVTGQAPAAAAATHIHGPTGTSVTWTATIFLSGVWVDADSATIDIGQGPMPASRTQRWFTAQCKLTEARPAKDSACPARSLQVTHPDGARVAPVYSGTRIWTENLDDQTLELMHAYGVGPSAPSPDPGQLRAGEVLLIARGRKIDTRASVLALGPEGGADTITKHIPSLRADARLPIGTSVLPLVSVDSVPLVLQRDGWRESTVPLTETALALRFGWATDLEDTDGNGTLQPRDLFPGLKQADVQTPGTDSLVRSVLGLALSQDQPWVSPIPDAAPALVLLTADQDYAPAAAVLAQSKAAEQAGLTVLLTDPTQGQKPDVNFPGEDPELLDADTVATLASRGHGVGIHPFVGTTPQEVSQAVAGHFQRTLGARPRVIRNHHVAWTRETPAAQESAGLTLGLDYIAQASAGSDLGFMGGTGVPMKYPETGVFHLPTQLDDHVLLPARFGYRQYNVAQLIARTEAVLDTAIQYNSVVVVNHHPIWWIHTDGKWQQGLLEAAAARKIPVWGAARYVRYLQGVRNTVISRTPAGEWQVLAPETGATVHYQGNIYSISRGSRLLRTPGESGR